MMGFLRWPFLLFLTVITFSDGNGPFVVNVAQTFYQAEENDDITLEWMFTTNTDSSLNSLYISCKLIVNQKDSVLYLLRKGVEVPESQDKQFAGRVRCNKDVLTEGKIRLHVSRLRTEDSGLYVCDVRTNDGRGSGECRLTVTAPIISATVGGSVLIPCSLPDPSLRLRWFYWQEDQSNNILFHWDPNGQTLPVADEYKNRCQVFPTEFSSGNIPIRLDNVTVGDDKKTFWAYVNLMDERNVTKLSEQRCTFTLQVSAPYQHLVLTVNNTANRATCTAHGGYPEPKVSWTGRNKSSSAQLDLQDAETSLQQDPTEKTFSVTSSVSVKEFQSVTCIIFNPRTNQRIKGTAEISASDEEPESYTSLAVGLGVGLPLSIIIILLIVYLYRKHIRCVQNLPLNANEDPAEGTVLDVLLNAPGQNQPEENIPLRRRNGAESSTDEDAASGGGGAEHDKSSAPAEGADPPLPVPADGNEENLQEDQPDQGLLAQDKGCVQNLQDPLNANEDPAEGTVLDVLLNVSGQNQPEGRENSPLRRRNGAESSTDAVASGGGGAEHEKIS